MVNLGNPDLAFRTAMLPNDGVGLARMEFIISEHIGIHPMALAASGQGHVGDRPRERSRALTRGYRPADRVLRRAAGRGRRHDRRGLLSASR